MQILHMVSYVLSRMCGVERVLHFYFDRERRQRSLCESRVICGICVSCRLLMQTFEAWENAQWLCANGSWSLTVLRISSLKLCVYRFQPAFFEKYKQKTTFSTAIIIPYIYISMCVYSTQHYTIHTSNATPMLFCLFIRPKGRFQRMSFWGTEKYVFVQTWQKFSQFSSEKWSVRSRILVLIAGSERNLLQA